MQNLVYGMGNCFGPSEQIAELESQKDVSPQPVIKEQPRPCIINKQEPVQSLPTVVITTLADRAFLYFDHSYEMSRSYTGESYCLLPDNCKETKRNKLHDSRRESMCRFLFQTNLVLAWIRTIP